MSERTYNVLFLCTGNSARSIMAEAIMNHVGKGKFRAYSAGSMPSGRVNPFSLKQLIAAGLPIEGYRSKAWDEFAKPDAPQIDFIFTVCDNAAGEVCPIWPGKPMTAHWGIPDPAAVEGSDDEKAKAFAIAFGSLRSRIMSFAALPLDKLEGLTLQQRLQEIGRTGS